MEVGSGFALSNIGKEMTELLAKKFGLELGLTYAIPKGGGGWRLVLHCQLVSITLKTHQKKFQLNRSRND